MYELRKGYEFDRSSQYKHVINRGEVHRVEVYTRGQNERHILVIPMKDVIKVETNLYILKGEKSLKLIVLPTSSDMEKYILLILRCIRDKENRTCNRQRYHVYL